MGIIYAKYQCGIKLGCSMKELDYAIKLSNSFPINPTPLLYTYC
jgi:hypothetical protein